MNKHSINLNTYKDTHINKMYNCDNNCCDNNCCENNTNNINNINDANNNDNNNDINDTNNTNNTNEYLENTGIYMGKVLSSILDTTTTSIQTCMNCSNIIINNCKKESSSSINRFLDLFKQK